MSETPSAEKDARCKARDPEAGRCRLYLGHDGNHGDGEGTVWAVPDWTGANTVRKAWERSPLLRSVKAARTKCQTCDGPVEDRAGELVCVSGSYLPHPPTRPIPRKEPVEMRRCDGCGEDYNAFEESHVGHVIQPAKPEEAPDARA